MKSSFAIFTLWVALASTGCQAWAPAGVSTSRATSVSIDRRRSHIKIQQPRATTSIYATIEDEEQEQQQQKQPSGSAPAKKDIVSDAFNTDSINECFSPIPYSELTIGIIKETFKGENRVSQTPDSVKGLVDAGFTVIVQSGGKTDSVA